MQPNPRRSTAGVTLTELLVVLVIVSLLATIAVPVVLNRQQQAKISVAKVECEELAKGEQICALNHDFFVPLQLLDNIPNSINRDPIRTDDLQNEPGGIQLISIAIPLSQQLGAQFTLNSGAIQVANLESNWQGPFVQWQRAFVSSAGFPSPTTEARDFPLDPWGNPYRLYSPFGIVGSTDGTQGSPPSPATIDSDTFSNGNLTTTDDRFDRWAVVSFGPDGVSDGLTPPATGGDDIIYLFAGRSETNF